MMRTCPHCGSRLDNSDVMCSSCGRLTPEKNEYSDLRKRKIQLLRSRRARKGWTKKRIAILLVIVLISALKWDRIKEYPDDPSKVEDDLRSLWDWMNPKYYKVAAEASYTVERKMVIRSTSTGSNDFSIRIPIPRNFTTADGTKIQVMRDTYHSATGLVNRVDSGPWRFFNGTIAGGETFILEITYKVTTETYEWDFLSSDNSGTLDQIPQDLKDRYLHDESMVRSGESSRPLINLEDVRETAEEVTEGKDTVYDMVRAIYKYILRNVKYQVGSNPKTCSETLNGGVGDCDDMVLLFSAMCRSVGIPAYPGYGFVSNSKFEGWGGHSWANVVIPDEDGDVFIPQIDLPNAKFLWYDPYRLIEWHSDGNEEHLSDYYYVFRSQGSGGTTFSQDWDLISKSTTGEKLIRAD